MTRAFFMWILLGMGGSLTGQAQVADKNWDHLYPFANQRVGSEPRVDASIQLYCDGDNLSLVAEIKDLDIRLGSQAQHSDHLEVWLALPASAYPQGFAYQNHPEYVYVPEFASRGSGQLPPRMFSIYEEYASEIALGDFLKQHDYPSRERIMQDSLQVPLPTQLAVNRLPFGIVGFAFFADGRPAELLNPDGIANLGNSLTPLGDLAAGISYLAEYQEKGEGYTINAQISPTALGFVQVPDQRELGVIIELADRAPQQLDARSVCTTMPAREPGLPKGQDFQNISFTYPLYTNFTGLPNELFYQLNVFPIWYHSQEGWKGASVDLDALMYRPGQASTSLMEVSFSNRQMHYQPISGLNKSVAFLEMLVEPVNKLSLFSTYYLFDNQAISGQRIPGKQASLTDSLFRFQDGETGLVLYRQTPLHPYGWGEVGEDWEDELAVYRIGNQGPQVLINMVQGEYPEPYCEIGELSFPDYQITHYDLILGGKRMVVLLDHRIEEKERKRIKISWEADGSGVSVEEVR